MKTKQTLTLAVMMILGASVLRAAPSHSDHNHPPAASACTSCPDGCGADHSTESAHQHEHDEQQHDAPAHTCDDHAHPHTADEQVHATDDTPHDHTSMVHLSPADAQRFGIEAAPAGPGHIDVHLRVPGELTINTDRMAHIVPTVGGIVRQSRKKLGDRVTAGEVLAYLESTDLGQAKIDYLEKWAEVACCNLDLTRAQQIHDNTINLLDLLEQTPSLQSLQDTNNSEMGENRSKLIAAYTERSFAQEAYQREKALFEQDISSRREYLQAKSAFEKTDAQYSAARDSIAFAVRRDLLEAQRSKQLQVMALKGAQRHLMILGLSQDDIRELEQLAQNESPAGTPPTAHQCSNPDCPDCVRRRAAADADSVPSQVEERLAWYPLVAPFDGVIIGKHITLGEKVGEDTEVFVIADLNTIWVDLQIYPQDIALVKKGQKVTIFTDGLPPFASEIIYVEPILDDTTRTLMARVVLDNSAGQLRPGTFIDADITIEHHHVPLTIDKDAVQYVDEVPTVFVRHLDGYQARPVTLGRTNDRLVEIVAGIEPGERIVTHNSFRLKAELTKTADSGCSGHSH